MTSEESGMSEGSDKRYVNRSQVSTSVFCLFCNNHLIPKPTSTPFSEKEVFKWMCICNFIFVTTLAMECEKKILKNAHRTFVRQQVLMG